MVYYRMEYSISAGEENSRTEEFYADNDNEAVELAKQKFLNLAKQNDMPDTSVLARVCRTPENLLKTGYRLSVKKGKDIYSLIED